MILNEILQILHDCNAEKYMKSNKTQNENKIDKLNKLLSTLFFSCPLFFLINENDFELIIHSINQIQIKSNRIKLQTKPLIEGVP